MRAARCSLSCLVFALFASLAAAQPATDLSSDDAGTPDPALSPEQIDSLPVESPGYTRPEPALSPEQINPPPVESLDYIPPDPALSPEQTDSPPSDDSPG